MSIVSDGWSDPQRRSLLNFMAMIESGLMFLKSLITQMRSKIKTLLLNK